MIDVSDIAARLRSARRSSAILRAISIVLLVAAIGIIGYPFMLQHQSARRLADTTSAAAERVAGWPYPQAEEALKAAHAYNERLAQSGQPILGEATDPFATTSGGSHASGEDSASAKDSEYQSLLDAGGGVMGSIRIPKVSVDLPIYHGTSSEALASGAGHLYGSSLPVGGANTHSVLTGHRGLVEAMMFTWLDEMKKGDVFYIEVMGETLAYKVDRITVIEPDDTSQLKITPGEDRVTLMTCTPYGVNTHRLLVSGLRAHIPEQAPRLQDAPRDGTVPAIATALAVLVLGLILVSRLYGNTWRIVRHVTAWPRRW
ncbi:class C sortase [Bifidobacterium pullorum]|uniref:class C sortase n=1 Tax=Bifidobacterium pullorum TaxID=78448 RepID=UPI001EF483AB|nr:class C sortase [Bifidobacterium pullorum]